MITPRRITLTSAPGLRALHRAIADACAAADPALARSTAVLVPTRSAATQLRRTLEDRWLLRAAPGTRRAVVLPDILTRGDWYRRLYERSGLAPRLLSDVEREVLMAAAARDAVQSGCAPPFRMRPGLVAEMLAFHDGLARQQNTVDDFERLVLEDLEPRAEFDRGAERLLRQTRFLTAAFRAFQARVDATGALDEHGLRCRLLDLRGPLVRRVVVTMGDRAAEPSAGLYPADFDLLSRLPDLESVDIVSSRSSLLAGLGERLRALFPGLEERGGEDDDAPPVLVRPANGAGAACFASRDREEELRDIARRIKRDLRAAEGNDGGPFPRVGVVFRRPLPYVYVGRTVFESAGIEFQASDALPLAAEPFSAALDLVFSAVTGRFARRPLLQLLRSPHFRFTLDGREASGRDLGLLDKALAEANYLGELERLRGAAAPLTGGTRLAAQIAIAAASALAPLSGTAPASAHLARLLSFLRDNERPSVDDEVGARHLRARAAVLMIVEDLRAAFERHDDPPLTLPDLAPFIRRWLEGQTFTPTRGTAGVELLDASSARYGVFDDVHLAGLVAGDWPAASARSVFYPAFLLARLGWPPESARLAAERAAFADLLRLAGRRVSVSTFTLEDDSIVDPSPLLDELERCGLEVEASPAVSGPRVFPDEALMDGSVEQARDEAAPASWTALRSARSPSADARFHGYTEPRRAASAAYTVTGIDRYLECPFKYFARTVLALPEEIPDEQGLSPRERGQFVHEVFRAFFAAWQAAGRGAIGVELLDEARSVFARVAEELLSTLHPAEAMLERLRLLGSVAAPGLGEIALAAEAVRPTPVAERLLEYSFEGEFTLAAAGATREVRLRGKADRVDLLTDGRLRVIDYKTGRAPETSVQLPLYALCLAQQLGREGRRVAIGEALYIAFGERDRPVETVVPEGPGSTRALEEAQERTLSAIDGIERGEFPPRPAAPRLCGTCAYAGVCRKDVVDAD